MNEEQITDIVPIEQGGALAPIDLFQGASGFEDVTPECRMVPFLKLAQGSTEQAKRGSTSEIKGLQLGQFFNLTSGAIYGDEIRVVLLKFYRSFAIYESRESDSKFLGTIEPEVFQKTVEPSAVREKSYWLDANGHRYVDNRNFILLNYDHLDDGPRIYSMASTGVAPSRKLLTLADAIKVRKPNPDYNPAIAGSPKEIVIKAPLWSNVWKLRASYFEASPNGYYQISDIERVGWVSKQYAPEIVELFSSFQQLDSTIIRGAEPTEPAEPAPQTKEAKVADRVFGPNSSSRPVPAKPASPAPKAGSDDEAVF